MNFEPIEIKINDCKPYADVALAIDSPFFINEANKIRKEYGIKTPLRQNYWQLWVDKNIIQKKGIRPVSELFSKITEIRAKMILTVNYQPVFEKAVFGCDIEENDYQTTQLINFQQLPHYLDNRLPISELYAILLTPQTRKKDVDKLYKKYTELMKKFKEDVETEIFFNKKKDYQGEIVRDRKWYWKKKGKTYLEIAQEDKERCGIDPEDYKETVRKAVKAYESFLQPAR